MAIEISVIMDGETVQTATYSVNAYAFAMKDDAEMGELAIALYNHGKSAATYGE